MNWIVLFGVIQGIINTILVMYQHAGVREVRKDDVKSLVTGSMEFISLIAGRDNDYVSMAYEIVTSLVEVAVKAYNLSGRWTQSVKIDLPEGGITV